jgi:hypothetical protein
MPFLARRTSSDLGHDDLGATLVDPGERVEQRHLPGQRADDLPDPRRERGDGLVQRVGVGQDLGYQEPVMVVRKRPAQRRGVRASRRGRRSSPLAERGVVGLKGLEHLISSKSATES